MSVTEVTEYFDDVYTTTWNNIRSGFVMEAFNATPFYYEVLQKRRVRHEGGKRFEVAVQYGGNTSVKWLSGKTDTVSLDTDEKSAVARYTMKVIAVNITRYVDDELAAYGNTTAEHNLVELTMGDAKTSIIDNLNDTAADDGSADANAPKGIPHFVDETPATGTTATISRNSYSWWRNQAKDMSSLSPVGNLEREMRKIYKLAGKKAPGIKGAARFPDIGFGGIDAHTWYEDEVDDRTLHTVPASQGGGVGALGFDRVKFKTVWLWWDPAFNDTSIWLLNSRYIEFRVHPRDQFSMTKWKEEANKPRARFAQITLTCCIAFLSLYRHCVLFDIGE